jgi:hypothetical protein
MTDEKDKQPEHTVKQSQNPGGEGFPDDPGQLEGERGRNVSTDEAGRAAADALAGESVTAEEIRDQSAYDGQELDVGQQAGNAEREKDRIEAGEEPPERSYPKSKP